MRLPRPAILRRRRARHYNRPPHAQHLPAHHFNELPAIGVGGALVFAYIDPAREQCTLRVSVDLDQCLPELRCLPEGAVPIEITVQGRLVYSAGTDNDQAADGDRR